MNKTIVITSGGTREYVDSVRTMTNISSGALGAIIADAFYAAGAKVHFIHAKHSVMPQALMGQQSSRINYYPFITVEDLKGTMEAIIPAFRADMVIHSAAVSDFTFDLSKPIKLSSSSKEDFIKYLAETIITTPKILPLIKKWRSDLKLVGFKFTVGKTEKELCEIAAKTGLGAKCDLMIANDLQEMKEKKIHIAYGVPPEHHGNFHSEPITGKEEIARQLVEWAVANI